MSNLSDVIGEASMYGSLTNISFVNDRFCNMNSAIFFNYSRGLQVPPGVYFSADFTLTAWLYIKETTPDNSRLIDFGNINYTDNVFVFFNSLKITYIISVNRSTVWNVNYGMSTNSTLELNKWYHITITLNGTTGSVYLNGRLAVSKTVIVPRNVLRNYNYIGRNRPIAVYDDLKLYQGAMSQEQILNDYIISSNYGNFFFFSKIAIYIYF